jgi:preprotein translocase subunit SecF
VLVVGRFTAVYEGNYKKYLLVPVLLLLACSFLAFVFPGVPTGIDLSGGTLILIRSEKPLDAKKTEELLEKNFELTDLSVVSTSSPLGGYGLTIRFAQETAIAQAERELARARAALKDSPQGAVQHAQNSAKLLEALIGPLEVSPEPAKAVEEAGDALAKAKESFSSKIQQLIAGHFNLGEEVAFQKKEVSPTLGTAFYATAFNIVLVAFILIVIVIFVFFRKIIPSAAVIASAVLDVIGALGFMAIFRIPLTLSSIPALLMLVGYSVDTDVMLTTKLLSRREQRPSARAFDALLTGLTMSSTTIAALVVMLLLSFVGQIEIVFQISAVLLLGLLVDLSSTWLMNAPVLLWYIERGGNK